MGQDNRRRYGLVPCGVKDAIHAYYDIVDLHQGADHVLAYRVRHKPAVEIVDALNNHRKRGLAKPSRCKDQAT